MVNKKIRNPALLGAGAIILINFMGKKIKTIKNQFHYLHY